MDLISTGVSEVSFSVSQGQAPLALESLQRVQAADPSVFERVSVEQGLTNVALVGQDGLHAAHLARAFSALAAAGIQPLASSCARSQLSLWFLVPHAQSRRCMEALHRAFFEERFAAGARVVEPAASTF